MCVSQGGCSSAAGLTEMLRRSDWGGPGQALYGQHACRACQKGGRQKHKGRCPTCYARPSSIADGRGQRGPGAFPDHFDTLLRGESDICETAMQWLRQAAAGRQI
eukprot:237396-Chlamydomonas_euryale.AAC.10